MNNKREYVELVCCPQCFGTGKIDSSNIWRLHKEIKCDLCKGKRRVTEEIAEEWIGC